MKRLSIAELVHLFVCPECQGDIAVSDEGLKCSSCNNIYRNYKDRPVMMRMDNPLFPPTSYVEQEQKYSSKSKRALLTSKIKKLVPSKSINLARERMFARISKEHGNKQKVILVVGCGNQVKQLEGHFPEDSTTFVFSDIDKTSDADIFCDAHDLAFKDQMFDGVISTAVLEHVMYPEKVISEIYRVLKMEGFVYSEIPFLQSVHEGAYDFTRYTLSGHRRLLEYFDEIETGMVAGPGTALVWSIVDFSKSLFQNRRLSSLSSLVARTLFFWLKYFDYLMNDNPVALSSASCTFYYGTKILTKTDKMTIIKRYEGMGFEHV